MLENIFIQLAVFFTTILKRKEKERSSTKYNFLWLLYLTSNSVITCYFPLEFQGIIHDFPTRAGSAYGKNRQVPVYREGIVSGQSIRASWPLIMLRTPLLKYIPCFFFLFKKKQPILKRKCP